MKKFDYDGKNPATNQTLLASYREGLPLLFGIHHILETESKSFSENLLKKMMLTLFDSMNRCFPGIHTRAAEYIERSIEV